MPTRTRQHELDTEAERYIESQLPHAWTSQPIEKDYGRDLRIEIFEDQQATGYEFVIQSKGHERFKLTQTNVIAQPISVKTLRYLDNFLIPSMVVAYSAEQKSAHYLWVRPYIQAILDKRQPNWRENGDKSEVTIHIPLENVFNTATHANILRHVVEEHAEMTKRNVDSKFSNVSTAKLTERFLVSSHRVHCPQITSYLHRHALVNKIESCLTRCHVFIHADAGFGKTWLVYDYVNRDKPKLMVWYTFDTLLLQPFQFLKELCSELYRQTNRIGKVTLQYLLEEGQNTKFEEAVDIFVNEIGNIEESILLIFEDIHYVSDELISYAINTLLLAATPNVRMILSSRHPLPFKQARLQAQGRLTIIGRDEITISEAEAKEYLSKYLQVYVPQHLIEQIHTRVGHWIAALGLAVNALAGRSRETVIELFQRLNGFEGKIYDFFAEEVYATFDNDTQSLLKRLSLVANISSDIVNLFTHRFDGGQILRTLSQYNTFLIRNNDDSYSFHSLFAEFLEVRLTDEEGKETKEDIHKILANHFKVNGQWYSSVEHAIQGQDYNLAIEGIDKFAPVAIDTGYAQLLLNLTASIPNEYLERSASIQEMISRAALQSCDFNRALNAATTSKELYEAAHDHTAALRAEYFIAEVRYETGDISKQEFATFVNNIAVNSYAYNDFFFASQIELIAVQTNQALVASQDYDQTELQKLIERCDGLLKRIENVGNDYDVIRAKTLATKAHLVLHAVSNRIQKEAAKISMREKLGFPVNSAEKIALLQNIATELKQINEMYGRAALLIKSKGDAHWAFIKLQHIEDIVFLHSQLQLIAKVGLTPSSYSVELDIQRLQLHDFIIRWLLPVLEQCREIFQNYYLYEGLAKTFCVAAEVYDLLGIDEKRIAMANEALNIAEQKQLASTAKQARKLVQPLSLFRTLMERDMGTFSDYRQNKELLLLSEEVKAKIVASILQVFGDDVDEERYRAVAIAVGDMCSVAKRKFDWCRHLQIVEDLAHQQSLHTMYRTIPKKYLTCQFFNYHSVNPGSSFDDLWPFFRGAFCLGCQAKQPYGTEFE